MSYSGGFTNDELLKLWKGLFYCLWMQDKPLLQVGAFHAATKAESVKSKFYYFDFYYIVTNCNRPKSNQKVEKH